MNLQQLVVVLTLFTVILYVCNSNAQTGNVPRQTLSVSSKSGDTESKVQDLEKLRRATNLEIQTVLQNTVNALSLNESHNEPNCDCGGLGWTRIINYAGSNPTCPTGWARDPQGEGCIRDTTLARSICDSTIIPANGMSYSRVCGRVNAIQTGATTAFYSYYYQGGNQVSDDILDGVTLSHGPANSRQHIWSFIAASNEDDNVRPYVPLYNCPCTNTEKSFQYVTPPYINNDYFCDTGTPGPRVDAISSRFPTNPLWDGVGCGPNDICCTFNNPPLFCKTLPQTTTDDIEARICHYFESGAADVVVTLMEIYVQ